MHTTRYVEEKIIYSSIYFWYIWCGKKLPKRHGTTDWLRCLVSSSVGWRLYLHTTQRDAFVLLYILPLWEPLGSCCHIFSILDCIPYINSILLGKLILLSVCDAQYLGSPLVIWTQLQAASIVFLPMGFMCLISEGLIVNICLVHGEWYQSIIGFLRSPKPCPMSIMRSLYSS